jgi:nucleotide-binding universal stress UspA family protein
MDETTAEEALVGEIVVGMDGSEGAAHALRWAVEEAGYRGWSVVAAMTWGYLDQHHLDGSTEFVAGYTEADADAALETFVTTALEGRTGAPGPEQVERRLLNDLPAQGLLDASREAELLVLGARGLGGFRGLLVGSVSHACLHHATCPVAIIREPQEHEAATPTIVVGIDGSPGSKAALDWALDEARARQARIEVVHAWSAPYLMGYSYGVAVDMTQFEDAARIVLDGAVEAADTHGLIEPVEKVLVSNGPSASLLEVAKDADLVVVGSRGVGGFKGMLLGSVSYQVTHHADCPVVVVPTGR